MTSRRRFGRAVNQGRSGIKGRFHRHSWVNRSLAGSEETKDLIRGGASPARPFLAVAPRGVGQGVRRPGRSRRNGMASKAKATQAKEKEEAPEKEEGAPDTPLPLLDLSDAGVKKMIKAAKKRGYVTIDQINEVMPSGEVSSDQIEDIYAMLNEMGINVVETEEADNDEGEKAEEDDHDDDTGTEVVESFSNDTATTEKKEPSERTDDPVRMYLREMGS